MLDRYFPQFGNVYDDTPSFAKAEAVALRVVSSDTFEIFDILISFSLLQGTLDAKRHSNNILSAIVSEGGRDPKYWRPAMQDRCKTNIAAMNIINENTGYSPSIKSCCFHILSNACKKCMLPMLRSLI